MDGRKLAFIVALLASTTALAGCMAPSDLLNAASTDGEVSALANRDLALDAARAWDPNAKLLGVFTLEIGEDEDRFPLDPNPGNGLAPLWVYAFVGDQNATRAFRVFADGKITAENNTDVPNSPDDLKPLVSWRVDSDDALETAAADDKFGHALDGDGLVLAQGVAEMDGITGWYFAAMSKEGSAFAIVNAATGELVMANSFSMDFTPPGFGREAFHRAEPTHVAGEGKLTQDEPKLELPFTTAGGDATFDIEIDRGFPMDGVKWTIRDAEGEAVEYGWAGSPFGFMGDEGKDASEFELEPGAYTLVLSLESMTPNPLFGGDVEYAFELIVGDMMHDHEDDEE